MEGCDGRGVILGRPWRKSGQAWCPLWWAQPPTVPAGETEAQSLVTHKVLLLVRVWLRLSQMAWCGVHALSGSSHHLLEALVLGLGLWRCPKGRGRCFHPGRSTTVFAKVPVDGWTNGRGCRLRGPCRAAEVVHVGITAGRGGGDCVLGVRRGHYEFLQAKRCVCFLRLQV